MANGEAEDAIATIRSTPAIELACIHVHLGTQIEETDEYARLFHALKEFWQANDLGQEVWLDMGGGFPFRHSCPAIELQSFRPDALFAALAGEWGTPRPPLLVEPGRWIAAPAFVLVARVVAHKERNGEPTIVVLDTGTHHNVMAAYYEHVWAFMDCIASEQAFRFCGPLCMEDDNLSGPMVRGIPKVGSLVAMANAGAYSINLARSFAQPFPPIFQVSEGQQVSLLRPKGLKCHIPASG